MTDAELEKIEEWASHGRASPPHETRALVAEVRRLREENAELQSKVDALENDLQEFGEK